MTNKKKRIFTEEHKKHLSESHIGHTVSDHHREAARKVMAEMNKRKYQDPEYKQNKIAQLRLSHNRNKKTSETIYIDEHGNESIVKDQDINVN